MKFSGGNRSILVLAALSRVDASPTVRQRTLAHGRRPVAERQGDAIVLGEYDPTLAISPS
ncbi:hypothetical protein [Methylosinus sp. LW4]|uniref:hypothetical protein n=1 Tax=Methylosinus sp. LW4 TaxID=136993 RepID=UPI000365AAB0|nr:hypothetical protein [Methylosinus sp. LW4]